MGRTGLLFISDLHVGKTSKYYDDDQIFSDMRYIGDQYVKYLETFDLDHAVIFVGGDLIEGFRNYKDQGLVSLPLREQINGIYRIFKDLYRRLGNYDIHFYAAQGNHGKVGPDRVIETDNLDVFIYDALSEMSEFDEIFTYDPDRFGIMPIIEGKRFLLHHGHDVGGSYLGISPYGVRKAVIAWSQVQPFDCFCIGHFHQFFYWKINLHSRALVCPCVNRVDLFAKKVVKHIGKSGAVTALIDSESLIPLNYLDEIELQPLPMELSLVNEFVKKWTYNPGCLRDRNVGFISGNPTIISSAEETIHDDSG